MSTPSTASTTCVNHPGVPTDRLCERCLRPHCADCLVALRGQTMCGTCKHTLLSAGFRSYTVMVPTRVATAPTAPAVPPPVAQAAPTLESPCALHEHQDAVAVCERCGDFICLLCLTPFEGRSYCLRCFELLWGRGEFGQPRHHWRGWENPGTAGVLATLAWLLVILPVLSWPPAIGAIIVSLAALRRIDREPERPGRKTAMASLIAGSLALVASIFISWMMFFWD